MASSRQLSNPANAPRDYGAMSTSSSAASAVPEVNFSSFSPTEFVTLSQDIAHNINAVNSSCKQLEKLRRAVNTPRNQKSLRTKVHNINAKTNQKIEATSKDLQRLNSIVQRSDKQQRLQSEKLLNEFRMVVEKYSVEQKQIAVAIKQVFLQAQEGEDESAAVGSGGGDGDQQQLLQRQLQMEAGMRFEHDMLIERERQIKQIESDILDVNTIMYRLSNMIQEQGEHVDRIETNIEDTANEVELGREELAKASQHRQSYRRKVLWLLAIAVIIGLIVTGIVVDKIVGS